MREAVAVVFDGILKSLGPNFTRINEGRPRIEAISFENPTFYQIFYTAGIDPGGEEWGVIDGNSEPKILSYCLDFVLKIASLISTGGFNWVSTENPSADTTIIMKVLLVV
ncbi:hypothetical protein AYI69_g2021 [Smittium culicis]|uniref:Uncharacterized protein n=1 Tax=Smittium culicis TaxID=133412 RepID=A0A1R1Y9P2_9FUNG|nr:hypothetical protein AYI69_g4930 [Smittium culicis]OMJ28500.1 hypothetical protein AYI69_g2021 [Smittium culicis]